MKFVEFFNQWYVSCAGIIYQMSPRPQIKLIAYMHADLIYQQCALYIMKISTKFYILSKKDCPEISILRKWIFWENCILGSGIAHNHTYHVILKSISKPCMYYFLTIRLIVDRENLKIPETKMHRLSLNDE